MIFERKFNSHLIENSGKSFVSWAFENSEKLINLQTKEICVYQRVDSMKAIQMDEVESGKKSSKLRWGGGITTNISVLTYS